MAKGKELELFTAVGVVGKIRFFVFYFICQIEPNPLIFLFRVSIFLTFTSDFGGGEE